jgi:hypothetical protein
LLFEAEDGAGGIVAKKLTLRDGTGKEGVLSILSPRGGSPYGAYVTVRGSLVVPAEAGDRYSSPLEYRVESSEVFDVVSPTVKGDAELQSDGSFEFVFSTKELTGPQILTVIARSKDETQTEAAIEIVPGDSDIPTFSIKPGDGWILCDWDPLPLMRHHSLLYAKQGASDWSAVRNVEPPYVLDSLANGARYKVRVEALSREEEELSSSDLWGIPLSVRTLRPDVMAEYGQLRLTWQAIAGADEFEVQRSTAEDGEYENISGTIAASSYLDTAIRYGKTYYYRINPAGQRAIASEFVFGQSLAFSQQRISLSGYWQIEDASDLTIRGDYAYLASGQRGLLIIDLYHPDSLEMAGSLETEAASGVALDNGHAFVADGPRGLKVIDIANPLDPRQIGSRKTTNALSVAVRGDYAFVADGEKGLKVLDVSSLKRPSRIASIEVGYTRHVTLAGDRAYTTGSAGLIIWDITDPAVPVELGRYASIDARRVEIRGRYAFVADSGVGLQIIDVADPSQPTVAGSYPSPSARDVSLEENSAFLADADRGVIVLDISDTSRPVLFDSFPLDNIKALEVRNDRIYCIDSTGFRILDLFILGKSFDVASCDTDGKAYGIHLEGERAYIADHQGGLKVVDITNPLEVTDNSVAAEAPTEYAEDVVVNGDLAFVADGPEGLKVIDLAGGDSRELPVIGSWTTDGSAKAVVEKSGVVYLADSRGGLQIIDVSKPNRPVHLIGSEPFEARDLAVVNEFAFVVAKSGLKVFEISKLEEPALVSTYDLPGARKLALWQDVLLLLGTSGLEVVDVSDPTSPKRMGSYVTPAGEGIAIQGRYAYLAESYRGLTVLDLAQGGDPVPVSTSESLYAVDVAVREGYAYVVDVEGLKVVQILIPPWMIP